MRTIFFCLLSLTATNTFSQSLPIKAERAIPLSTSEGTRMDVDISPDGKTIVFSLLGNFYTIPSVGGKAVQLTHGLSWNRKPAWSPDGKHLTYLSDSSGAIHCWVMDADGSHQRQMDHEGQLEFVTRPSWSANGSMVVAKGKLYHLWGGELPMPEDISQSAQFSPDGKFVYYYSEGNDISGKVFDSVKRHDCRIGKISGEYSPGRIFCNAVVSPDGHWMAYVSEISDSMTQCSLRLLDLQTGKDKLLSAGIDKFRTVTERYTFTPDSREVVIGYGGKLHKLDIQTGRDDTLHFEVNTDVLCGAFNYNTYRITHDPIAVRYMRNVSRRPDGRQLVFAALNQVYKMDLPDGKPQLLTDQTDAQFQPVYSPDGKWITYVTWNDSTGGNLWRVAAEGGQPVRMSPSAGHFMNPAWSPDGKYIAVFDGQFYGGDFSYDNFGKSKAVLVPMEGGKIITIADSVWSTVTLAFSPGGDSILFTYKYDATQLIGFKLKKPDGSLAIPAEGECLIDKSAGRSMMKNNLGDLGPATPDVQEIVLSPDGRYYALVIQEDIYLSPVVTFGGEQVIGNYLGENKAPLIRISRDGGIDPHWEKGGKALSWSFAGKFYSVSIDKVISNAIDNAGSQKESIVPPDETVSIPLVAPQHYAVGTIALSGARVITMHGVEVIEKATIIITDGRITRIGRQSAVEIPEGVKVLDLKGATIMPGLIDLHAHMAIGPFSLYCQQPADRLAFLAFGVTTARDPSSAMEEYGEQELLATGKMVGPRLFTSGDAFLAPIKTFEEARSSVRKHAALGGVLIKQYEQPTRLQRQWVLLASKEAGMNMTNEGDFDLGRELSMAFDGSTGIEHMHALQGNIYGDVKGIYTAAGTWLTPTLQCTYNARFLFRGLMSESYFYARYHVTEDPKLNHFMSTEYLKSMKGKEIIFRDTLKLTTFPVLQEKTALMGELRKEGVRVTMGSHGDCAGIGAHYEVWGLKMGGLTNMEALREGTILAAEGLGMQQDIGSIETGKIADLVILDKNPLDKIENTLAIRYVMKDGILYESQTLKEIWPRERPIPNWKYERK